MRPKKVLSLLLCLFMAASSVIVLSACDLGEWIGGVREREQVHYVPGVLDPVRQYNIDFMGWGEIGGTEHTIFSNLIEDFHREYPNVRVSFRVSNPGAPFNTALRAAAGGGGTMPDVFFMPLSEFRFWAGTGHLLNIAPAFAYGQAAHGELDDIWPHALDLYRFCRECRQLGAYTRDELGVYRCRHGRQMLMLGLPKDLGPFTLVFNRTLLMQQYNANSSLFAPGELNNLLNPNNPMNKDQFVSLLTRLLATNRRDGLYGITHYDLEAAINSNNASFFCDEVAHQRVTEQNFIDALQWAADLYLAGGPGNRARLKPAPGQAGDGFQMFVRGDAIFSFMGPWDMAQFWQNLGADADWDILPVPFGPGADREFGTADDGISTARVGSMAYSIYEGTMARGNATAAMTFIRFMSSNVIAQRRFFQQGQQVPNHMEMARGEFIYPGPRDPQGNPRPPSNRAVFVDIMDGVRDVNDRISGRPYATYFTLEAAWFQTFNDALVPLWNGTLTAETLMRGGAGVPTNQHQGALLQQALEDMNRL